MFTMPCSLPAPPYMLDPAATLVTLPSTEISPAPSVFLTLPELPTIRAHVRWADEAELGLFFESPIPIQIIAGWLGGRLRVSA